MTDIDRPSASPHDPTDPPAVELTHALDDEDHPSSLTVFPRDRGHLVTAWITIDLEHAIPLDERR